MELLVRIVLSNYNELWQVRILLPRPPAFASPLRVKRWRIESFGDPFGMCGPTRDVQRPDSARRGYVIFFI
jgi:hypothetical protein